MNDHSYYPNREADRPEIGADDYELAEAALVATDAGIDDSIAPALRLLRDECGWTLHKSRIAVDRVQEMRRGRSIAFPHPETTP